jgi:hypothetical protein
LAFNGWLVVATSKFDMPMDAKLLQYIDAKIYSLKIHFTVMIIKLFAQKQGMI